MRVHTLSMFTVLLTAYAVRAQNVPLPKGPDLGAVLAKWDAAMAGARDFSCEIKRETNDKALFARDLHHGKLTVLKKGKSDLIHFEMFDRNKKLVEKYIVTDKHLYEYAPASKVVRVHDLPKGKQPGIMTFVLGFNAQQAQARFDMKMENPVKPDVNYHYIRIKPKAREDFREVQLSLLRAHDLPARIWYLQPNLNESTWNFTDWRINTAIQEKFFEPDLKGWRVVKMQPPPAVK